MTSRLISNYITLPILEFCDIAGLGQTLVRAMVKDGRLKGHREGKKLLIVVQSYLDRIEEQNARAMPEYKGAMRAVAARKAKRRAAPADPTLEDLGL
jgi:hypothetical protein